MLSPETLLFRFGLALVLGFAIGLEREREKELVFAGMRTFALISLLGSVLAYISDQFADSWLFIAGFLMVASFGLVSYFRGFESGHIGITTEVVFMLSFMLGALVYWEMITLAAAITVGIIGLLTFKPNLQSFAARVHREDILAGLEFAIVWIVVLPLLPNRTYDPFNVINPHEIWVMVVLVSAINLASYILAQVYGAKRGIGLTGLLGGMVSSTVVTFDFARRSKKSNRPHLLHLFALAIAIASTGMFLRIVFLTFIFNPELGISLVPPMLAGALVMLVGVAYLAVKVQRMPPEEEVEAEDVHEARSPFALKPALQFGLMFAAILILSKAAETYLGVAGTYLSSIIGGIAGLDAVALSMAKLANTSISEQLAMRSITFGAASNTLFKGIIATWLGEGAVRTQILPLFVVAAAVSIAAAFLF